MNSVVIEYVRPAFWLAIVQIATINILLSGDNVVAIALACRELPPSQRLWGVILGAGFAVVLAIFFAGIVSVLMLMPYLKLIGGLALLYIALKLDAPGNTDSGSNVDAAGSLWRVARVIAVANIVMSFDNVIAIAAAAKGNVPALVFGLAISIPLVIAGAGMLVVLLNRFPILVWAGAGLLGWIAGEMMATDPAIGAYIDSRFRAAAAHEIEAGMALAGAILVVSMQWRRRPGRRAAP